MSFAGFRWFNQYLCHLQALDGSINIYVISRLWVIQSIFMSICRFVWFSHYSYASAGFVWLINIYVHFTLQALCGSIDIYVRSRLWVVQSILMSIRGLCMILSKLMSICRLCGLIKIDVRLQTLCGSINIYVHVQAFLWFNQDSCNRGTFFLWISVPRGTVMLGSLFNDADFVCDVTDLAKMATSTAMFSSLSLVDRFFL